MSKGALESCSPPTCHLKTVREPLVSGTHTTCGQVLPTACPQACSFNAHSHLLELETEGEHFRRHVWRCLVWDFTCIHIHQIITVYDCGWQA